MKIKIIHPNVGELSFPLEWGDTVAIGRRGGSVDYEFNWDRRISRNHARLSVKDNQLWFEDLGSKNGSWHAEHKLKGPVCLDPGMTVLVGETVLCVPTIDELEAAQQWNDDTQSNTMTSVHGESSLGDALSTEDLRTDASPKPEPKRPALPDPRQHARFVADRKVEVRTENREQLGELWLRDISKGGLFVESATPPPSGTKLEVDLSTPHGTLRLSGKVVHVICPDRAKEYGSAPGVGLQFTNLNDTTKRAIQAYVDGLATQLAVMIEAPVDATLTPVARPELLQAAEEARAFLNTVENQDVYQALKMPANSPADQLNQKLDALRTYFSSFGQNAPPPQATRLKAAIAVIERTRRLMNRPGARLEYDFQKGHHRVLERLALAKTGDGPNLELLRRSWQRAMPEGVDRSAHMMRKAFASRQRRDFPEAISAGKRALELNPFFEELRSTINAWEELLHRGVSP